MKIDAAWHEARTVLKKNHSNEYKRDAQLLLEHVLKVNHAWLIAHADDEIKSEAYQQFATLIQRRMQGEPIAYILGKREFYGLTLTVTPATLIPRSDTETLVDAALAHLPPQAANHILDLGTGSGAIALAIAKQRPNAKIMAVDASPTALKIAKENAQNLNISNVQFVLSNWFSALKNQSFDMIVSNPPYIEQNDVHLKQGDLRFEPHSALVSGKDGLDDIRTIIQHAAGYLHPQGWLMLEHGYNQTAAVSALLASAHFNVIETRQDMGENNRVSFGRFVLEKAR